MAEEKNMTTPVPTAPYNFVPFADAVLVSPLNAYVKVLKDPKKVNDVHASFRGYLMEKETFSGHFVIEVENLTPFYIGNDSGFFSVGKNLCVPGSSMRGCIKNIFKIITASAFRANDDKNPDGDVDNGRLYFRSFASSHEKFKEAYKVKVTSIDKEGNIQSKINAGYLVKLDKAYFICPAEYSSHKARTINQAHPTEGPSYEWKNDRVVVYTGKINNKRFYSLKKPADWNDRIRVPDEVIKEYEDDTRRGGINLLAKENRKLKEDYNDLELLCGAEEYESVIPCFYVINEDKVTSFGSGPYYRIPYDKRIGEHIPKAITTTDVDFTDAVFGCKDWWGSRVYFEDLYLRPGETVKQQNETSLTLMGPNPTSFQNYLCASGSDSMHWDTDANLRGYKMYWHRNLDLSGAGNKNNNVVSTIRPLIRGHKFVGRIRFDNLRAEELGALAYVLDLCKDGRCLKLGKGKPYGLGCVCLRIEKLCIKDQGYYQTLFSSKGFNEGNVASTEEYVKAFKAFISGAFDKEQKESYKRSVNELKIIMDSALMDQAAWNERTRYLEPTGKDADKQLINGRMPLPKIEEVVKHKK